MNPALRVFAFCLAPALATTFAHGAVIFQTNFDSPGYTPGSLEGHAGWSFTNNGTHSWHIAAPGSTSPKQPTSLAEHPDSLRGGNLFWIAARTENLSSTTNTARLSFTSTPVAEVFSVSFDLYVGPQGGSSGSVFNFALSQGETVGSTPVRFWLHGGGSDAKDVKLRFSSGGTSVASLPEQSWYRFTLDFDPVTSTSGTWGLSIHTLDSEGNIADPLYSISGRTYSGIPAGGFDTFLFQTVSNRSDFWVDSISASTEAIPEPHAASLVAGGLVMLATLGRRRR